MQVRESGSAHAKLSAEGRLRVSAYFRAYDKALQTLKQCHKPEKVAARTGVANPADQEQHLSKYEMQRAQKMIANARVLEQLGLADGLAGMDMSKQQRGEEGVVAQQVAAVSAGELVGGATCSSKPHERPKRQGLGLDVWNEVSAAGKWPDGQKVGRRWACTAWLKPKYADQMWSGEKPWEGRPLGHPIGGAVAGDVVDFAISEVCACTCAHPPADVPSAPAPAPSTCPPAVDWSPPPRSVMLSKLIPSHRSIKMLSDRLNDYPID